MQAGQACQLVIAVIASYNDGQSSYCRLETRAREYGLCGDGAYAVRMDRVVVELLLREKLSSPAIRELLIPSLLVRRVLLSWWRPSTPGMAIAEAEAHVAADPQVICATSVPPSVKTWVMGALEA